MQSVTAMLTYSLVIWWSKIFHSNMAPSLSAEISFFFLWDFLLKLMFVAENRRIRASVTEFRTTFYGVRRKNEITGNWDWQLPRYYEWGITPYLYYVWSFEKKNWERFRLFETRDLVITKFPSGKSILRLFSSFPFSMQPAT